jgi:hypothetical protein
MTNSPVQVLHHLVSAGVGKQCEDRIGMFNDIYWLLDGASLPATLAAQTRPSTQEFVDTLAVELAIGAYESPQAPLRRILRNAIEGVAKRLRDENADKGSISPSSTVVLLRARRWELDYLVLGDSYLLIDDTSEIDCISDQRIKDVAPDLRARFQSSSTPVDSESARAVLVHQELKSRNQTGGYWIAADDPSAVDHAIVGKRTMTPGSRLLAMSDGFAASVNPLNLYPDWGQLTQAVVANGMRGVLQAVRDEETRRRISRPSEPSDDASALLIEWQR